MWITWSNELVKKFDFFFCSGEVDEDAYDMRKALKMDAEKKSIIPLKKPIHIDELEY